MALILMGIPGLILQVRQLELLTYLTRKIQETVRYSPLLRFLNSTRLKIQLNRRK